MDQLTLDAARARLAELRAEIDELETAAEEARADAEDDELGDTTTYDDVYDAEDEIEAWYLDHERELIALTALITEAEGRAK